MNTVRRFGPVLVALTAVLVIWYVAAVPMNRESAQRIAGDSQLAGWSLVKAAWSLERPILPAPHQVAAEIWDTTVDKNVTSKRSLIYHTWKTLAPTMLGFFLSLGLGVLLAVGIVLNKAVDRSAMPWVIASQTIPILALAPMVIVVLGSFGLVGLLPKAVISMYLSFFPITIGMVKGLRSPDLLQLDLMRSYSATPLEVLVKLRLPASVPYLFASMKVAVAAALIGTIVGELPTGAQGGLGARLLSGSYYGQTIQIWSALFMAAAAGALMIVVVGLLHRMAERHMGGVPA